MPTKPALASVTIWGVIFAFLCTTFPSVASGLHLGDASTQKMIETFIGTFGTLISLGVTLYGRYHTSVGIAGIVKTPAPATGGGLPPAAANLVLAFVVIPLLAISFMVLSGCASAPGGTNVSPGSPAVASASLRMEEGKALTAAYQAGDALAVELDAAARSGVLKGSNAVAARQALMDLQAGLSTAQSAYAAGDATTGGQIASLASLLSAGAALVPIGSTDQATIQTAISLAQAFASAS